LRQEALAGGHQFFVLNEQNSAVTFLGPSLSSEDSARFDAAWHAH
jgi:hypothetical protein